MDTLQTVTELAARQFGADARQIDVNAPVDQLGIDSLDFLEFLFTLEDHFAISIPQDDVRDVRTLAGVAEVIDRLVAIHASTSP